MTIGFEIVSIDSILAEKVCRDITADLPDYFGIIEANERYAKGMLDRISFAALVDSQYVGLITVEFPFSSNANIYWMAVKSNYQDKNIGLSLIKKVEEYCLEHDCTSMTVETLSPKSQDVNYLRTYNFYERAGFKPLFELNTHGPEFLMVYMHKSI